MSDGGKADGLSSRLLMHFINKLKSIRADICWIKIIKIHFARKSKVLAANAERMPSVRWVISDLWLKNKLETRTFLIWKFFLCSSWRSEKRRLRSPGMQKASEKKVKVCLNFRNGCAILVANHLVLIDARDKGLGRPRKLLSCFWCFLSFSTRPHASFLLLTLIIVCIADRKLCFPFRIVEHFPALDSTDCPGSRNPEDLLCVDGMLVVVEQTLMKSFERVYACYATEVEILNLGNWFAFFFFTYTTRMGQRWLSRSEWDFFNWIIVNMHHLWPWSIPSDSSLIHCLSSVRTFFPSPAPSST